MEMQTIELGGIADVIMGQSPKSEYYNSKGQGMPFLQGNRTFGFKHPTFDTYTTFVTKKALAGDIIMSVRAPVGELNITPVDMCLGRGVCALRMKNGNQEFLYYLLKYYMPQLLKKESGTVFGSVNRNDIENLETHIPTDGILQQKVGRYLTMIDDRIELNNTINDNLQQQVAALFSNFYDRADTKVGFTEIVQVLGGGTPKTGESSYWNGNIPFFTPKDVGTPYTLTTEKTITEDGLAHCNSRLYPINTAFVTARGTVGKVGLPGVPMAMNQSCYALVGKDTHQLLVYFYTLKVIDRLKHKASGAVFDAITTRDFESESIMQLSDTDAMAFLNVAEPMYQTILRNSIENLRLATLRDALLPKLMSGEIDVSTIQL